MAASICTSFVLHTCERDSGHSGSFHSPLCTGEAQIWGFPRSYVGKCGSVWSALELENTSGFLSVFSACTIEGYFTHFTTRHRNRRMFPVSQIRTDKLSLMLFPKTTFPKTTSLECHYPCPCHPNLTYVIGIDTYFAYHKRPPGRPIIEVRLG